MWSIVLDSQTSASLSRFKDYPTPSDSLTLFVLSPCSCHNYLLESIILHSSHPISQPPWCSLSISQLRCGIMRLIANLSPGTRLSALPIWSHLVFTTSLWGACWYYNLHLQMMTLGLGKYTKRGLYPQVSISGFESQLCHILTRWTQKNYFTFLNLFPLW